MRAAEEIDKLQAELGKLAAEFEPSDDFQFGMICGKLYALTWIQERMTTDAFCVNESFDNFIRQFPTDREDLNR
jgi:hypothetical protein